MDFLPYFRNFVLQKYSIFGNVLGNWFENCAISVWKADVTSLKFGVRTHFQKVHLFHTITAGNTGFALEQTIEQQLPYSSLLRRQRVEIEISLESYMPANAVYTVGRTVSAEKIFFASSQEANVRFVDLLEYRERQLLAILHSRHYLVGFRYAYYVYKSICHC